ncbi:MAG: putative Ig domain-containing protein [Verrucomicrobiota bacterium]
MLIGTANFRDITSGNNAFQNTVGFSAGTGYDPATGIGVPNVATLVATLSPGSTRAPTFTDGPPPSSSLAGTSYSFTYTAGGSPAPTFSVTSGELPPGLALSSSGVISGTTPLTGFFSGTVTAGNSAGSAQQTFTITVGTVPSFSSTPLTASIPDESAFSFAFVASGFPAPTFAVTSGSLPPGLTLQPNGTVTGSPTASGTFSGTITASNGFGNAVTQSFTITVGPPATDTPTMPPWSLAALGALLAAAALRTRARAEARG